MAAKPRLKILITGSNGFLGARLYAYLKEIDMYDIFLAARDFSELEKTFQIESWQKRFFSLDQAETFDSAVQDIDVVIHLAALDFKACENDPVLARRLNVDAVTALLASAERQKVQHFIYLSTFHVYGVPEGEVTEKTPTDPRNAYALTHLQAEQEIAKSSAKIQKSIIRLSNCFGRPLLDRQSASALAVNDFCLQAVKSGKIVMQSSGHQFRDFVGTDELCSLLNFLMQKDNLPASDFVYNLGSGRTFSLLEMARLIQNICVNTFHHSVTIEQLSDQPTLASQKLFVYSCDKIKSLGYKSSTSVEEAVRRLLAELFSRVQ